MRSGAVRVAGLALLVAAGGCSDSSTGDDEPVSRAPSAAQFCGALTDYQADLANADPSNPTSYVVSLQAAATRLAAVGAPTDLPAEARAALDATLAQVAALPEAPTDDDLAGLAPQGRAERDHLAALDDYVATACSD